MSKRIAKLQATYDTNKAYSPAEAIEIVKKNAGKKFDETVEVHFRLGINAQKGDQQVRGTFSLPNSFGKAKTIAAFVTADRAKEAKEAGADVVYTEDMFAALQQSGKIDFEVAVAIPDVMKTMAPLARFLGPKGLMPSPKNETLTTNLKKTIEELKKGKLTFKNDTTGNLHIGVGKASMDSEKLLANLNTVMEIIKKAKPESSKGIFIKKITLTSTMGPGVKLEIK